MTISEIPAAIATCAFYIMMIFLAVLSFPVVLIISVVESFLECERLGLQQRNSGEGDSAGKAGCFW